MKVSAQAQSDGKTEPRGTDAPLTKAQRAALEWFGRNGRACMFGAGEPSLAMVRKLENAGLVETAGKEPGKVFGFTYYQLSAAGRAAIAKAEGR